MSLRKKWLKNFKLFEDFVTCQFLYLIKLMKINCLLNNYPIKHIK